MPMETRNPRNFTNIMNASDFGNNDWMSAFQLAKSLGGDPTFQQYGGNGQALEDAAFFGAKPQALMGAYEGPMQRAKVKETLDLQDEISRRELIAKLQQIAMQKQLGMQQIQSQEGISAQQEQNKRFLGEGGWKSAENVASLKGGNDMTRFLMELQQKASDNAITQQQKARDSAGLQDFRDRTLNIQERIGKEPNIDSNTMLQATNALMEEYRRRGREVPWIQAYIEAAQRLRQGYAAGRAATLQGPQAPGSYGPPQQ